MTDTYKDYTQYKERVCGKCSTSRECGVNSPADGACKRNWTDGDKTNWTKDLTECASLCCDKQLRMSEWTHCEVSASTPYGTSNFNTSTEAASKVSGQPLSLHPQLCCISTRAIGHLVVCVDAWRGQCTLAWQMCIVEGSQVGDSSSSCVEHSFCCRGWWRIKCWFSATPSNSTCHSLGEKGLLSGGTHSFGC